MRNWILAFLLCVAAVGCDMQPPRVRPLPAPPPEQPAANLPKPLHQRNWTGPLGQGSCVHASLVNHLRWLNEYELGERWRATYSDGEWDSRLRNRLDAAGNNVRQGQVRRERWGFDVFYLTPQITANLPKLDWFLIGKPGWDYWLPLHFLKRQIRATYLADRLFYHHCHGE